MAAAASAAGASAVARIPTLQQDYENLDKRISSSVANIKRELELLAGVAICIHAFIRDTAAARFMLPTLALMWHVLAAAAQYTLIRTPTQIRSRLWRNAATTRLPTRTQRTRNRRLLRTCANPRGYAGSCSRTGVTFEPSKTSFAHSRRTCQTRTISQSCLRTGTISRAGRIPRRKLRVQSRTRRRCARWTVSSPRRAEEREERVGLQACAVVNHRDTSPLSFTATV